MESNEILKIKENKITKIKTKIKKVSKEKTNSDNNNNIKNKGKEFGQTDIQIDNSSARCRLPINETPKQSNSNSSSIIENQKYPSLYEMDIISEPVNTICPYCKMKIRTEVEKKYNFLTFCCSFFLFFSYFMYYL